MGWYDGVQGDMVLEKKLSILHLDPQVAEKPGSLWVAWPYLRLKNLPSQWHISSNKNISPNSGLPISWTFNQISLLGAIPIQTTHVNLHGNEESYIKQETDKTKELSESFLNIESETDSDCPEQR